MFKKLTKYKWQIFNAFLVAMLLAVSVSGIAVIVRKYYKVKKEWELNDD